MDDKLGSLRRKPSGDSHETKSTKHLPVFDRRLVLKALPWVGSVAVLTVFILLFGERILPAAKVETETVVTLSRHSDGKEASTARTPENRAAAFAAPALFQASGWFEADPYPYRATTLVSGVVDSVMVLEGESVSAGQVLATLIREDADLQVRRARGAAEAAQAALAAAEASRQRADFHLETLRNELRVAESRREELEDLARRAENLGPTVLSEEEIIQAGLRLQTHVRTLGVLDSRIREQEAELTRLGSELEVREGNLAAAEARLAEALLALERTVIRSPVDGIVQRLLAAPGQKKLLMSEMPESATIALLFQPDSMQARIDIPIAEAGRVSVGQAVLVESEFFPGKTLRGQVSRIVGEADLQRNTLQVKVALEDPPQGIRPDILCRARFLDAVAGGAGSAPPAGSGGGDDLYVLVPEAAVVEPRGEDAAVWVVDGTGSRAERREIVLTGEVRDRYRVVRQGLRPGDRVIVSGQGNMSEDKRITY